MAVQLIALVLLTPFTLVFVYAGIHEYLRYKSEGRGNYGLVYDEETGTTHVTGIAQDENGYDPDAFDPNDHNDQKITNETDDDRT